MVERNKIYAGLLGAGAMAAIVANSLIPCRGTTRSENDKEIVYGVCVPSYGRVYLIDEKANGPGLNDYELSGDSPPRPRFPIADAPEAIKKAAETAESDYAVQQAMEKYKRD